MAKVEAITYGDRKVYSVAAFNRGIADWLSRLPTVWVEGEITELRRQERWAQPPSPGLVTAPGMAESFPCRERCHLRASPTSCTTSSPGAALMR